MAGNRKTSRLKQFRRLAIAGETIAVANLPQRARGRYYLVRTFSRANSIQTNSQIDNSLILEPEFCV